MTKGRKRQTETTNSTRYLSENINAPPAVGPVLFWAGKRRRRDLPALPLEKNEIVCESRVAQIIARAQRAAAVPTRASEKRVEFYTHDGGWKNKLICGDSLLVMASLLHYEGLQSKVQMIYVDPPYGIKYDSQFRPRANSTKVRQKGPADAALRVKAFRDTWTLGLHSYLSYLQERLYLCRELLAPSGSIFVQINDDQVHHVRHLLDEIFGAPNFIAMIAFYKTSSHESGTLPSVCDYLLWFAKERRQFKHNALYIPKEPGQRGAKQYTKKISPDMGVIENLSDAEIVNPKAIPRGWKICRLGPTTSPGYSRERTQTFTLHGKEYHPGPNRHWSWGPDEMRRLAQMGRIRPSGQGLASVLLLEDNPITALDNIWMDTGTGSFTEPQVFAVQTAEKVVSRCILLASDPGDLVFDPTGGSGTTAYCAERWGRRWITCDTSRVAIHVTRKRLLSAVYPYYVTAAGPPASGFRYQTVPHYTLDSTAKGLAPESVDLIDRPFRADTVIRVSGPFELMTFSPGSVADGDGDRASEGVGADAERLPWPSGVAAIGRLYYKGAALSRSDGPVRAVAEGGRDRMAVSVGPLFGPVTAEHISAAVESAVASGMAEVHILGWAFAANVGDIRSQLERSRAVRIRFMMVRPDALVDGLQVTRPELLFSPLALPDVAVAVTNGEAKAPEAVVTLQGVSVFDRKRRATEYYAADSGYVAAWYLDEDYDGDCFVARQMFFDFDKTPNLKAALPVAIDPAEYTLRSTSRPFSVRAQQRLAVKVVDVYGNESTVVKVLA